MITGPGSSVWYDLADEIFQEGPMYMEEVTDESCELDEICEETSNLVERLLIPKKWKDRIQAVLVTNGGHMPRVDIRFHGPIEGQVFVYSITFHKITVWTTHPEYGDLEYEEHHTRDGFTALDKLDKLSRGYE